MFTVLGEYGEYNVPLFTDYPGDGIDIEYLNRIIAQAKIDRKVPFCASHDHEAIAEEICERHGWIDAGQGRGV